MSFDIFVTAFQDGKPRAFPRAMLEKAFGPLADMSDPTWWKLKDSFAGIQVDDEAEISDFSVNRPPGDDHPFWPALLRVLDETSSVLYWPGGGPVAVNETAAASVPPVMVKKLGAVQTVKTVAELMRLIGES